MIEKTETWGLGFAIVFARLMVAGVRVATFRSAACPFKGIRDPVHSEVPILLLSAPLDWATPTSRSALASSTLSRATMEVFPLAGRQTYFMSACSRKTADLSLDDPKAATPRCNGTRPRS